MVDRVRSGDCRAPLRAQVGLEFSHVEVAVGAAIVAGVDVTCPRRAHMAASTRI